MIRLLAYSPALALLAVGIILAAAIPPLWEECPPPSCPANEPCPAIACAYVTYPGVVDLLVAWGAALGYAIVVWRIRRRRADSSPSVDL